MYSKNLERGVYAKRCKELKTHFQNVLQSDNIEVDFELKQYTNSRLVFYKVRKDGKFIISEQFNRLIKMKELWKKRKEHNKLLEINKIKRF